MNKNPKNMRVPEGWDAELWLSIAPEVRDKLAAKLREKGDSGLRSRREMNAGMANMLSAMQATHKGALSRVDMAELASRDPQALARLHATARNNGQALDSLRGRSTQLERNLAHAEAQRTGQRIASEVQDALEAVLPRIAKLVGEGFERKAFKLEMARYLLEQGVPAQAVCAMSRGYELELCTKAMLFDKMQKRRAEAEAKLADVPAVLSPRRSGREEGDRLGRARAALNKNPNSTEALAALFAAM